MRRKVSIWTELLHSTSKALELPGSTQQFPAIQLIVDLKDPSLLKRYCDLFVAQSRYDKTVELLVAAKKPWSCAFLRN